MSILSTQKCLSLILFGLFFGLAGCPGGGSAEDNGTGATGVVVPPDAALLPIDTAPSTRPEIANNEGPLVFGPANYSPLDFQLTSIQRTFSLGHFPAGRYRLKFQNGNYGPFLAQQCANKTVVAEKRQCLYDNLIEKAEREFSRVDTAILSFNGKKSYGGKTIPRSTAYFEQAIDLKAGDNLLKLDLTGFPTSYAILSVEQYLSSNNIPRALFSLSSMSGNAPFKVNFNASHSYDPDGQALTYSWDFGDTGTANIYNPSHTYQTAGEYNATLTVTDPDGNQNSFSAVIVVKPKGTPNPNTNKAPILAYSVNYPDPTNLRKISVSLDGSYDPDGVIQKYSINFGDGVSSTSSSSEHTYTKDGTYLLSVKVTDNLNATASKEQSLSINSANQLAGANDIWGATYRGSLNAEDRFPTTLNISETNEIYQIRIQNADGEAHAQSTCTGTALAKLPCLFQNLVNKTYVALMRVDSAHIYVDGKRITANGSIDKNHYVFASTLKLNPTNKIEVRLRGLPTSYVKVYVGKMVLTRDVTPPMITTNFSSGTVTNNKHLIVSVQDGLSTATRVLQNGVVIVPPTSSKSFEIPGQFLYDGQYGFEIVSVDTNTNEARLALDPVTIDTKAPILISDNISSRTYFQNLPGDWNLTLSFDEAVNLKKDGIQFGNFLSLVSAPMNITATGDLILNFEAQDLAGNTLTFQRSTTIVQDNTAPLVSLGGDESPTSMFGDIQIPVVVQDVNPTNTIIKVNGAELFQTAAVNFNANVYLPNEGPNLMEVEAIDEAGNHSLIARKTITKDTVSPSIQLTNPSNNQSIDRVVFPIAGSSSEALKSITVDGMSLKLSEDKKNFTGTYTAPRAGVIDLHFIATDLAGNQNVFTSTVSIDVSILNSSLIALQPDSSNTKVLVLGSPGAARPGISISTYTGVFGISSDDDTISRADGSFRLTANISTLIKVKAKDNDTNETAEASFSFTNSTSLSGLIKDSDDNPLPGVTLSFIGSNLTVQTDGTGSFSFPAAPSGDQTLVIDGSTIPQAVTGPQRRFSLTKMKYNLGLNRRNVLKRPVFLTPVLSDGSESPVIPHEETYIASTLAPGLEITVPADSAIFPSQVQTQSITAKEVISERTTVYPPMSAEPTSVYALEPSGLKFTQRAEVILPNANELPAKTEVLILSMNSSTGEWEIDGAGKVTEDGQRIQTAPGKGISHFSMIYAIPAKPYISDVSDPNVTGVDISKGSLTEGVQLPSFKSLGSDFKPGLVYKSSWANPTAFVTNRIDIPKMTVNSSIRNDKFVIDNVCSALGCSVRSTEIKQQLTTIQTYESNYVPDRVRSQLFVGNVTSGITEIVDSNEIPPNRGDVLPGGGLREGVNTNIIEMSGIPSKGVLSYAVPLKDGVTNEPLESGRYPYLARYEFRLKQLVIRTFTSSLKVYIDGDYDREHSTDPKTEIYRYQTALKDILPQDVTGSLIVQNKVKSEFGSGWKLNLGQKIINPQSTKMILEEADGSIATYNSNSTVSTLYDLSTNPKYVAKGLSLANYPEVIVTEKAPGSGGASIYTLNATNQFAPTNVTNAYGSRGNTYNHNTSYCPNRYKTFIGWYDLNSGHDPGYSQFGFFRINRRQFAVEPVVNSVLKLPDGTAVLSEGKEHQIYRTTAGQYQKIAGLRQSVGAYIPAWYFVRPEGSHGSTYADAPPFGNDSQVQDMCQTFFGGNCSTVLDFTDWSCKSAWANESVFPSNYNWYSLAQIGEIDPSAYYNITHENYPVYTNDFRQNVVTASNDTMGTAGSSDNTSFETAGFNDPREMRLLPDGTILLVDFGNNKIRKIDLTNNFVSTFAGDGDAQDIGDNVQASQAKIFHPTALHVTHGGEVFIASQKGFIRKVTPDGILHLVGGLPVELGGYNTFEGPISTFALNNPQGIAFDEVNSLLYIADTGNNRIVRFDLNSEQASTIAGTGICSPSPTLSPTNALEQNICAPTAIALDQDYNIIYLDSVAMRIQKIKASVPGAGSLIYLSSSKDLSTLVRNPDGTFARKMRNGSQVAFNSLGLELWEKDRAGNAVSFEYDSNNHISKVTDPVGQVIQISYSGDRVSSLRDPAGRTTSFNYSDGTLTRVNFPDGTSKRFDYNSDGMMTQKTDEKGAVTAYAYNEWNRLSSVTDPNSKTAQINDSVTGSMSNDFTGTNVGTFKAAGVGENQVQDKIQDPKNNTIAFSKDINGFISTSKNAKGEVTTITRDIDGLPLSMTYADGAKVTYTYDPNTKDQLSTTDVSTGITESQTYDAFGSTTSQTNGNGRAVYSAYDPTTGFLLSQTSPSGQVVSYSYNTKGQVLTKSVNTGAQVLTTNYGYDQFGNLILVIAPDGKSVSYSYDLAGNVTQSSSGGETTTYQFDAFNRLKSVTTPKQETTEYTYLLSGELSKIKDPQGKFRAFEYDINSRLIRKTEPTGEVYAFGYDANGNLISETDPNGNVKNYSYDELNRLVQAQFPDDLLQYQYSVRGQVLAASNKNSSVNYIRDTKNRILYQNLVGVGDLADYPVNEMNFAYDNVGNRTSVESNLGALNYSYDIENRLTSMSHSNGNSFNFGYDQANRLTGVARPGSRTDYSYTDSGVVSQILHSAGGNTKASYQYAYDSRNLPVLKRSIAGDLNYSYDGNGQLKTSSGLQSENFNYDSIGNRVSDQLGAYGYDSTAQKLTQDWQYNYSYDANGNLTAKIPKDVNKPAYSYSYSSQNQLVRIQKTSTANGPAVQDIRYAYDVLGRRMSKSISDSENANNSKIRRYIYDGDNILGEFDENSNLLASFIHSPLGADDVLSASVTSDGVTRGLASSAGHFYYLKDALGSITEVVNSAGSVLQKYEYSSFGKITAIKNGSDQDIRLNPVLSTSFTFTGREWDSESGLYFYRARTYDPQIGRFLQKDPDPGNTSSPITMINKYSYVGNSPIFRRDPTGNSWLSNFWDHNNDWSRDLLVGVVALVAIVASGGSLTGAIWAVLSTAGGAAASAGAIAAFQGGDFWQNTGNNFHGTFRISAAFLAAGAAFAPGGVREAGGSGLQGWIRSEGQWLKNSESGLTLGSTSVNSLNNKLAHELGHTIQYIGISAWLGQTARPIENTWLVYLTAGLWGATGGKNGVWETTADFLGGSK